MLPEIQVTAQKIGVGGLLPTRPNQPNVGQGFSIGDFFSGIGQKLLTAADYALLNEYPEYSNRLPKFGVSNGYNPQVDTAALNAQSGNSFSAIITNPTTLAILAGGAIILFIALKK